MADIFEFPENHMSKEDRKKLESFGGHTYCPWSSHSLALEENSGWRGTDKLSASERQCPDEYIK